jgi:hypothetical protein
MGILEACLAALMAAPAPEPLPVALDVARPTLVLFIHPGAPEDAEALREVAALQKRLHGRLAVSVRVYRGDGPRPGWERMPVWKEAGALSGDVAADPEGIIARRLGVPSSKSLMVFAPSGRLMFSGPPAVRGRLARLLDAWRGLENGPVVGVSKTI